MRHPARLTLIAAVAACWLAAAAPRAEACPNCRDSVPAETADAPPPGALAEGFAWSIILMLSMPAALVAGLGGMLYVAVKRGGNAAGRHAAPAPNA